jgi:hypothetical protein
MGVVSAHTNPGASGPVGGRGVFPWVFGGRSVVRGRGVDVRGRGWG